MQRKIVFRYNSFHSTSQFGGRRSQTTPSYTYCFVLDRIIVAYTNTVTREAINTSLRPVQTKRSHVAIGFVEGINLPTPPYCGGLCAFHKSSTQSSSTTSSRHRARASVRVSIAYKLYFIWYCVSVEFASSSSDHSRSVTIARFFFSALFFSYLGSLLDDGFERFSFSLTVPFVAIARTLFAEDRTNQIQF